MTAGIWLVVWATVLVSILLMAVVVGNYKNSKLVKKAEVGEYWFAASLNHNLGLYLVKITNAVTPRRIYIHIELSNPPKTTYSGPSVLVCGPDSVDFELSHWLVNRNFLAHELSKRADSGEVATILRRYKLDNL